MFASRVGSPPSGIHEKLRTKAAYTIICDRLIGVLFFFKSSTQKKLSDDSTLIEAVEDGWWYSADLPDSCLVLAYMTDADLYARSQKQQSNNYCLQGLLATKHTQARVKPYIRKTGPHIVPANSSRLDRAANGNWLAIGDAAMAFDPLSGQGMYKALESALRAARSIQEYWTGNSLALRDYALTMERDFERYFRMRRAFYSREQRWPQSVFWRRRSLDSFGGENL